MLNKWLCFRPSQQDEEVDGWDQLPADIVGALFEKSGRRKDAKNIRLVCRAWREASKYHIKSIVLKTHCSFFRQMPPALPALRDIYLGDVRSCQELLPLLQNLPFLTRLSVHCTRDFTCPNSIELLDCELLQDLTISSCSPFVPILETVKFATLFPSLLRLRILKFGPYGADTASFSKLTSLTKLLELEIPTATNIDNDFLASMSLTKLVYGYSDSLKARNLCTMRGLQHLTLPCCGMHSQTLMFSDLTRLTCLELRGAQITDDDLCHLTRLINLCTLSISSCKYLLGSSLAQLHPLSSLRYLDISHSWAVDDDGMLGLGRLTSLTDVRMSGCRYVTHVGADALTSLTNIRHLDASDCHAINYNGVGWILHMFRLKTVNFARSPISLARSAEGNVVPSQRVPVENMDLTESGEIRVLVPLLRNMMGLRSLNISGVWGSDDGLGVCLLAMSNLTFLDLGSSTVNDNLLKSVGKISRLVSLSISGCTNLTDKGLSGLATLGRLSNLGVTLSSDIWLKWIGKMANLTRLDVSRSEVLTRQHLSRISRFKNLTHLICSGCNHVCLQAFTKLQRLRYLETVDIRGWDSVNRGEVQHVLVNLNVNVL